MHQAVLRVEAVSLCLVNAIFASLPAWQGQTCRMKTIRLRIANVVLANELHTDAVLFADGGQRLPG